MSLTTCRDCKREVSTQTIICPYCGAPQPYKKEWNERQKMEKGKSDNFC